MELEYNRRICRIINNVQTPIEYCSTIRIIHFKFRFFCKENCVYHAAKRKSVKRPVCAQKFSFR